MMISSRLLARSTLRRQLSSVHYRQRLLLLPPPASVLQQATVRCQSSSAPDAKASVPRHRRDRSNPRPRSDYNHINSNHRDARRHRGENSNNSSRHHQRDPSRRNHHDNNKSQPRRSNGTPRAYQKRQEEEAEETTSASWRDNQSARKLNALHAEMSSLVRSYQAKLFETINEDDDASISMKRSQTVPDTAQLLLYAESLHLEHDNDNKVSWSNLEDTEVAFRELCSVLQHLISTATVRGLSQSTDAEKHLRTLAQVRSDRAALVQKLAPPQVEQQSDNTGGVASNMMNWISNIFVPSPDSGVDDKDDTEKEKLSVSAHNDSAFAPRKRHFKDVIGMMFYQLPVRGADTDLLIDRADRLLSLLELAQGMELSNKALMTVVQAHGAVGRFDYAQKAEEVWRNRKSNISSDDILHTVIRAYALVSWREEMRQYRSKAAKQAERLVLERWEGKETSTYADNSATNSGIDQHNAKCIHFAAAMKALANAGEKAIPEQCERAENLVIKCLGKSVFASLYANDGAGPKSNGDKDSGDGMRLLTPAEMHLLHHLMSIYASHNRDDERMGQARAILRSMEIQYAMQKQSDSSRRESNNVAPFSALPSLETYRAMVTGIRNNTFYNRGERSESLFELANYANGLIDSMTAMSITPDVDFFDRLLKIWVRINHVECGEQAEAILSRLQLKEIYDLSSRRQGADVVTSETYLKVLGCWKRSALASHPQAAERADQLLRFMEAQSGTHSISLTLSEGSSEEGGELPKISGIYESVYNNKLKPGVDAYNKVLQVCASVKNDSSKEKAVDIALDVNRRLRVAGIKPNEYTNAISLFCISKHLPRDSPRQADIMSDLLGMNEGNFSQDTMNELKKIDKDLHLDLMKGTFN